MTSGSSMLAMILSLLLQRAQPSISMPNTRLSRRAQPAGPAAARHLEISGRGGANT